MNRTESSAREAVLSLGVGVRATGGHVVLLEEEFLLAGRSALGGVLSVVEVAVGEGQREDQSDQQGEKGLHGLGG
jgi:hypothetical protein